MLTIAHMTAGAALGSIVPDSPVDNTFAFALGVGSHYVLDAIPHWENWFGKYIHGFPPNVKIKELPPIAIISGIFDLLGAVLLFWFFYYYFGTEAPVWESPMFWGALGGFFPDLLDSLPIIKDFFIKIPGVKFERHIHHSVHISEEARRRMPYYLGLLTQLFVVTLGICLLWLSCSSLS